MNRTKPQQPAPPSAEEAQAIFARCRSGRRLTAGGLARLPGSDQQRLIRYLTAYRMPVYAALVAADDWMQQARLRLQGYTPGHALPTGLIAWTGPCYQPGRLQPDTAFTLADIATIRQRK